MIIIYYYVTFVFNSLLLCWFLVALSVSITATSLLHGAALKKVHYAVL